MFFLQLLLNTLLSYQPLFYYAKFSKKIKKKTTDIIYYAELEIGS